MKTMLLAVTAAVAATPLAACGEYGTRPGYAGDRYYSNDWAPERHYRSDKRYHDRRMTRDDTVWRGRDGRYYCKRDDGTAGLVVGAIAGGVLGNLIAPGGSKTLGTLLGAGAGGVIGNAIDKGDAVCR
ncbi:MAG: glycine zipper 2TM domain-containing protein [Pseudomonadota bacterium]